MHQRGTLDVTERAANAPELVIPASEPLELGEARVIQWLFETPLDLALLPPSLHPSLPEHISLLFWDCHETPYGPARVLQVRVGCRTGILPRGFVVGAFCDNAALAAALMEGWGFSIRAAEIDISVRYSQAELAVRLADRIVLGGVLRDPVRVPGGELAIAGGLNLAQVDGGPRLVQTDFTHRLEDPENGVPTLQIFEATELAGVRLDPRQPIVASMAQGSVQLRPVRYLVGATELAADDTVDIRSPGVGR